jgi:hypothetical protein
MVSPSAEKSLLLPTVESRTIDVDSETPDKHHHGRIEYGLLIAALLLTAFQFLVLYDAVGSVSASLEKHCYASLSQIARGLRISIPASLPTAALLFILTPYIAQKERVVITRYMTLVVYLMGSTLGALLI